MIELAYIHMFVGLLLVVGAVCALALLVLGRGRRP